MKRLRHQSPELAASSAASGGGGGGGSVASPNGVNFRFPSEHNAYSQAVLQDLMDPKKARAFERFRTSVADIWRPEFEDDFYLFRWVKARQFDAKKAEQMLRAHLEWRVEFRADAILEEFAMPTVLADYYTGGFCGHDREGRPVWYDPIGRNDPEGLARSATREELIRGRIYVSEWTCRKLLPRRRAATGRTIYQLTVVYDFAEFGRRQMWPPSLDLFLELTRICEANYPETMGLALVINAPALFPALFNMLKPLLHKDTQSKIHVLGENYQEVLRQYIAPDQLPVCYGGTRRDPDGDPTCSSCICYGGLVPPEYYLKPVNADRLTQATVGRRSALKIDLTVKPGEEPATIEWEFVTEEGDIGFEIYLQASAGANGGGPDSSSDQQQQRQYVVQLGRVESDIRPSSGSVVCPMAGSYVAKFDNGHSWTKSKKLSYYLEVRPANGDQQRLLLLQKQQLLQVFHENNPKRRRGARLRFVPPEDAPTPSPTPSSLSASASAASVELPLPPAPPPPPTPPQQQQQPPAGSSNRSNAGSGKNNHSSSGGFALRRQESQESFYSACSHLSDGEAPDVAC